MDGNDDYDEPLAGTRQMFTLIESEDDAASHTFSEHIILDPTPTDSPNDPLNWSPARKYWHAFLALFYTAFTAATSNDAGAGSDELQQDLGIDYAVQNTAAGVLFIGIGYWTLLAAPMPVLYGRRLQYFTCLIFSLIGAVWFARIRTVQDAIWNQLFVGASESCAEALVQYSLSDLFFQHRRGLVLGLYVLATSIGTFLGPLVAGYIAAWEWRWVGWSAAIITGATLVVFYFGFEETMFHRELFLGRRPCDDIGIENCPDEKTGNFLVAANAPEAEVDRLGNTPEVKRSISTPADTSLFTPSSKKAQQGLLQQQQQPARTHPTNTTPSPVAADASETGDPPADPPKTYWQRIAIITPAPNLVGLGIKQYFSRLYHTLRVFAFPAVLYAGLQWGAQDAWLSFYLTIEEDNWYDAPWFYTNAEVSIMNIPTLIGALIGCVYGGWLSDYWVQWLAKRRGGLSEAEDRLWLSIPSALINPAGLMLFGIGSAKGWLWPRPYVGLGMIGFGWGCAGDLSMAYLMDAYPEMVLEGMVGVAVINNSLAAVFTFIASDWIDASGVGNSFIAIGVLSCAFQLTVLPMLYWGKWCRKKTAKQYRKFLYLRDGR